MFDELKNLNIEVCSDSELKVWIKQTIPVVILFMQAIQKFFREDSKLNNKPEPVRVRVAISDFRAKCLKCDQLF